MSGSGIDWSAGGWEDVVRRHRWAIPERLNIATLACSRHADGSGRHALTCVDEEGRTTRHSFDDLDDASSRLAGALGEMGVARGDRVAVFLPQRLETALAHLAAFKLGAVSLPLSPLFRADALAYRLAHGEARVLVTDEEHRAHLPEDLPPGLRVLTCEELAPILRDARPLAAPADTSRDDPAMLIYTSGTTGMPRGAVHAHRFLPGRLSGFELMHRLEAEPSRERPFWTPADWAWIGGLVDCVLTPWVFGCPVLAFRRRGFVPEVVLDLVARERVRSLFLPPTAVRKLRAVGDARADVVSVHTAGEPLGADDLAWAVRTFGPRVFELYGMTEMGATIGNCSLFPARPGSMGRALPGHEVAILDERGVPVPAGTVGEIAIRRGDPGMFLGYHRDPAATAARYRGDWLVTGDLARRDEDGYVWFEGRADDVFNTSGYRVGPTEIEATLCSHAAVAHAAVVGEPDAERGHVVKAFVVLRAGTPPSEALRAELQAHVRARLATYEVPRKLIFAKDLPMTVTGKIRRAELRAEGADELWGHSLPP